MRDLKKMLRRSVLGILLVLSSVTLTGCDPAEVISQIARLARSVADVFGAVAQGLPDEPELTSPDEAPPATPEPVETSEKPKAPPATDEEAKPVAGENKPTGTSGKDTSKAAGKPAGEVTVHKTSDGLTADALIAKAPKPVQKPLKEAVSSVKNIASGGENQATSTPAAPTPNASSGKEAAKPGDKSPSPVAKPASTPEKPTSVQTKTELMKERVKDMLAKSKTPAANPDPTPGMPPSTGKELVDESVAIRGLQATTVEAWEKQLAQVINTCNERSFRVLFPTSPFDAKSSNCGKFPSGLVSWWGGVDWTKTRFAGDQEFVKRLAPIEERIRVIREKIKIVREAKYTSLESFKSDKASKEAIFSKSFAQLPDLVVQALK